MPAEAVAQCGQHLVGEGILLARAQPLHQRQGDHRRRHLQFDRLGYRPAALARIGHVGRDALQRRVVVQRIGRQVQQPGADHAAMAPDFRHLRQIQRQRFLALHDRKAFGIGLHHSVLDAVVDHLGEVAGTAWSHAAPAAIRRRRQGFQQRAQPLAGRLVTTDHQAVALRQPPHAATGAAVEEMHAAPATLRRPTLAVLVVGVAAIDHDVARLQQRAQRVQRGIHGRAGRHHQPQRARRRQRGHQGGERVECFHALRLRRLARGRAGVETGHPVPAARQPRGHVRAHAPQTDHTDVHATSLRAKAQASHKAKEADHPSPGTQ